MGTAIQCTCRRFNSVFGIYAVRDRKCCYSRVAMFPSRDMDSKEKYKSPLDPAVTCRSQDEESSFINLEPLNLCLYVSEIGRYGNYRGLY